MYYDRIFNRVLDVAYAKAESSIGRASKTLAKALIKLRLGGTVALLYIPHYWAIFVHDGRVPFVSRKIMIWFRNPRDDPRLSGGRSPERLADLPVLTREQYLAGLQANKIADPTLQNPRLWPMIITSKISTPTIPTLFFDNKVGMAGVDDLIAEAVRQEFSLIMQETVGLKVAEDRIVFNL